MLSAATRVAGRLVHFLAACIFGTAGGVVGAIVGFLSGFINESGLMQGTLIGAITGALVSVEVADSVVRIWCSGEYSTAARIERTLLVFRKPVVNGLLRASLFPTISTVLDSQMNGLAPHFGRGESGSDMFEPSYPVMAVRRAAVDDLPVTKLTEQTAAGEHTACPICLHDFEAGESARRLPACCHLFHRVCIDSWLQWHAQCPTCRRAVY